MPRALALFNRALMVIALVILLFHLGVYIAYAANIIPFPFDYDQGEGFELYDTLLFSQFQSPYRDIEVYPYYASNYPPVFHLVAVPFAWVFGPQYWYGRLLGFIGTLIAAYAIGYAVWRDGRQRRGQGMVWIAVLAGLAFLASNITYRQGPLLRQHMFMVMFETVAVVILTQAEDALKRRRLLTAIGLGLLILAGYTKQLAAYSAIAVLGWMFIRNPRRAIAWGALFAAVGVGIFALLYVTTGGQWWKQAIAANVNNIFWPQVEGLFRLWFGLHGFLVVPALLLCLYELYFERLSLYTVWFAVTLTLGGVSSGTWGGGDSYFATSVAGLCLLSGIFFSRWLSGDFRFLPHNYLARGLRALRPLAPLTMALALIAVPALYIGYGRAVLKMPTTGPVFETLAQWWGIQPNALNGFYDSAGRIAGGYSDIGHFVTEQDYINAERIADYFRQSEKPVLSEEAGFSFRANRDVITNPTQLLNIWLRGMYDGSELIARIDRQEFGYVLLRAQFYPTPVLLAIARAYDTVEVIPMNGFEYMIRAPHQRRWSSDVYHVK
jgi:4-amino-4-deoxy-L-arabinose transferase-like glycosyltransferase